MSTRARTSDGDKVADQEVGEQQVLTTDKILALLSAAIKPIVADIDAKSRDEHRLTSDMIAALATKVGDLHAEVQRSRDEAAAELAPAPEPAADARRESPNRPPTRQERGLDEDDDPEGGAEELEAHAGQRVDNGDVIAALEEMELEGSPEYDAGATLSDLMCLPLALPLDGRNPFPRGKSYLTVAAHYDPSTAGDPENGAIVTALKEKLADKTKVTVSKGAWAEGYIYEIRSLIPALSYDYDAYYAQWEQAYKLEEAKRAGFLHETLAQMPHNLASIAKQIKTGIEFKMQRLGILVKLAWGEDAQLATLAQIYDRSMQRANNGVTSRVERHVDRQHYNGVSRALASTAARQTAAANTFATGLRGNQTAISYKPINHSFKPIKGAKSGASSGGAVTMGYSSGGGAAPGAATMAARRSASPPQQRQQQPSQPAQSQQQSGGGKGAGGRGKGTGRGDGGGGRGGGQ